MVAVDSRVLAIQSVEDPFYFALFGAILDEANRHRRAVGELVVVRAMSGAIGVDWRAWVRRSVPMTWILSTQWVRAFAGLIDRVAYRSHSWGHPLRDLVDAAWRCGGARAISAATSCSRSMAWPWATCCRTRTFAFVPRRASTPPTRSCCG